MHASPTGRRALIATAVVLVATICLAAPAILMSYSVDNTSFYDGVSDMTAFETSDTIGVAMDSQGGLRLATDGTPTVSTWSSKADFLGQGPGALEGELTAEATGEDTSTGSLVLQDTPLALDMDSNNPVVQTVAATSQAGDAYEVHGPSVIKLGTNNYRMYYTGVAADGYRQRIFEASSTDGVNWNKYWGSKTGGSVLDLGPSGSFDEYGLVRPAVTYDASLTPPYRMWYGGLGRDFGAIGYAFSSDGHEWTKFEDASGTPLPVVSPGFFGSADGYAVGEPTVVYDPLLKQLKMWYGTSPSADINGRGVGYATSQMTTAYAHGAIWDKGGRVEMDLQGTYNGGWFSPSAWLEAGEYNFYFAGKSMNTPGYKLIYAAPFSPTEFAKWVSGNIAASPGNATPWDRNNLYWASVLADPAVGSGGRRVYYTGSGGPGTTVRDTICYVGSTSKNFTLGSAAMVLGPSIPSSRFDTNQSAQGTVWQDPSTGVLNMFYAGRSAANLTWRIGLATSTVEATSWARVDGTGDPVSKAVFVSRGSFDASGAAACSVVSTDTSSTSLLMAYEAVSAGGQRSIGIARGTSSDLTSWTSAPSAAFALSGFDAQGAGHPSLVSGAGNTRMYYAAYDGTTRSVGMVVSNADGSWSGTRTRVMTGDADGFDSAGVSDPVVAFDASATIPYHMWYTAEDAQGVRRVAYANSTDGIAWTKQGLAVVPSGEPWTFDEFGVRAGSAFKDLTTGTYHLYYDGIDRGNSGNSAENPVVNWMRIGHASGSLPGYVSDGQATYSLVPSSTPGPISDQYQYDFRDFTWDATSPAGSAARYEVSFYPGYMLSNGTLGTEWSPWVPIDGDVKPMLPLYTQKIRWRVSLSREAEMPTATPVLDEMRVTWAPVHFETTGTAISIPISPSKGRYIESWTNLTVATQMAGTTSGTVSVLDDEGRLLIGPSALSNGANTVSLAGIDPNLQSLRVQFDFSGDGESTPYVKNWKLNYVSTDRAPAQLFQGYGGNGTVRVTWVEPDYEGLNTTIVRSGTDTFPASPTDGTLVYEASATAGASSSYETASPNGVPVYYTAWTFDGAAYSPPARTIAIPRSPISTLTANPLGAAVDLKWSAHSAKETSYYAGVTVMRRETTEPIGPNDPNAATVAVTTTSTVLSATDTGVRPGSRLRYTAHIRDTLYVNGLPYDSYTLPATATAVPVWEPLAYFDAKGRSYYIDLWGRVPMSGAATYTVIIRKSDSRVPTSTTDGSLVMTRTVVAGQDVTATVRCTYNLRPWAFSAFLVAQTPEGETLTSPPAKAAGLPRTNVLSGFKASAGDRRVTLSWTRPSSYSSGTYKYAYSGVRIMKRTGAYPVWVTDPDAAAVVAGTTSASSFVDTRVVNLTPYGYRGYNGVRIYKFSGFTDYDYGTPASPALATPKYTATNSIKFISYKKYASPYYYYLYGKSITATGTVSPSHFKTSTTATGTVTAYFYLRKYNSRTRKYYYSLVKKASTPLAANSTWKYAYRGPRGIYQVKCYFPGDGDHLPAWSSTRYARIY